MKIFNLCWASRRARRGSEDLISRSRRSFRIAAKANTTLSTDRQHQQPFSSETMTRRDGFGGDQRRTRTLQRDGSKCQCCGSSINLQVHHLTFRGRLGSDVIDNFDYIVRGLSLPGASRKLAKYLTRHSSNPVYPTLLSATLAKRKSRPRQLEVTTPR
jgi:hypothetical protein